MGSKRVADALAAFDGRQVAPLSRLVEQGLGGAACDTLLKAVPGPNEVAATWVIKALFEQGSGSDLGSAFARLGAVEAPDAVLHLLQSVQYAPDASVGAEVAIWPLLSHRRGLLRVWALDALVRIRPSDPAVRARLQEALDAKEPAMRARARALSQLVDPPLA